MTNKVAEIQSRVEASKDEIIKDLSGRILNRDLFKTIRIVNPEEKGGIIANAKSKCAELGFDSEYYLHVISTQNMVKSDGKKSLLIQMEDKKLTHFDTVDRTISILQEQETAIQKAWVVVPREVKRGLSSV